MNYHDNVRSIGKRLSGVITEIEKTRGWDRNEMSRQLGAQRVAAIEKLRRQLVDDSLTHCLANLLVADIPETERCQLPLIPDALATA